MATRYKELTQKRADLVAEQRAIFARVEKDRNELSADEKKRDDEIHAALQALAPEIEREERRREWERTVQGVSLPGEIADITGERDNPAPFKSMGEQLQAVVAAAQAPAYADPRLEKYNQLMAATGMHEGGLAEGGAFVQTQFSNELMERTYETGKVLPRLQDQPIGDNQNAYSALLIKETSRATGSRYGGLRVYRTGEGATITASRPDFDRKEFRPYELAALCYLTSTLVTDAVQLEGHVRRLFPLEASYLMENELWSGTGAGQSMGILNATATVSQAKESGQAAASILAANVSKMYARLWIGSRGKAAWYYNQDCEAQLDGLFVPAGVGGITPAHIITYGQDGGLRIKGLPAFPVEYASSVGTVGDLALVDFGQYLGVRKGDVQIASSIHVAFVTNEMALRFVWRFAAEPLWRTALTPANGSNTVSPFVTLATRA